MQSTRGVDGDVNRQIPQYENDLETIWLRIAANNADAADLAVIAIERTIARLAEFPGMGLACPHLAPDLRRVLWRDYVVFYRWRDECVELVRVLHGRRKISSSSF